MKKLLLPLLPLLLAPMLVGCVDKDLGWKEVKENEMIEVHFDNTVHSYYRNNMIELKYRVVSYSSVMEIYVNHTNLDGVKNTKYYVGNNLMVYHYEI